MRLLTQSVVVQLLLGAFIKAFIPFSASLEDILSWTTFAVIGLFMSVGLQVHPKKFSQSLGLCITLVLITTFVPFAGFYFLCQYFGLDILTSMTISVVLITTGTGVTVQTLSNLGYLHTRVGEFLTLVSALDDVPAAILMAILIGQAPIEVDLNLSSLYFYGILSATSILCSFFVRSKKGLACLFFLFGIGFSKVMESFHVSLVMGGLISGGLLGLVFRSQVKDVEETLGKILKPILIFYMIYIGMKLSPNMLGSSWAISFSVALTIFAIFIKWILTYIILRKQSLFSANIMAWGMVPRGIPGFAFATAALTGGLINQEVFTILVLIVSITTWIGLIGLEYSLKNQPKS